MSVIISNRTRQIRGAIGAMALAAVVAIGGFAIAGNGKGTGETSKKVAKVSGKAMSRGAMLNELRFIENKGQWDSRARFGVRTPGLNAWVTDDGVIFDVFKSREIEANRSILSNKKPINRRMRSGHVVKMEFLGMSPAARAVGTDELASKQNYIMAGAHTSAPVFQESRLVGLYGGIDARLYIDSAKPRYDLVVAPGADPSQIRFRFDGANGVRSNSGSDLSVDTSVGPLAVGGLVAYQRSGNNQVNVPARFVVDNDGVVSFQIGKYDRSKTLVIDPIVYNTLLGGTGGQDYGFGVKVDSTIHAFVVGTTDAFSFPTSVGAYDEVLEGLDGFCTKFLPDGSDVAYSTLLGGDGDDIAYGVTLDPSGDAFVVGATDSTNWPATSVGPRGDVDGFVIALSPDGTSSIFEAGFGGALYDDAVAVAIDQNNDIYIVGSTNSFDFPVNNALQPTMKGDGDAYLAKVSTGLDGSFFAYSTYLGSTDFPNTPVFVDDDYGIDVAVDDELSPYVLMESRYNDAPTVPGSFDLTANGRDCVVMKLAPDGQSLDFGTFLGGNATEVPRGIALDTTNNVFVTGITTSFNFPRTLGVFDRIYNNGTDSFITKLNRTGTALVYSTFCGFAGGADPWDIAVDDLGFAHVGGRILQTTLTPQLLPVTPNADDPTFNGPASALPPGQDAFIQVLNPSGTAQQYCSYMGGSSFDGGYAIALDGARNAYLTGFTQSCTAETAPWPTTPDAFKLSYPQDTLVLPALPEGFLAKVKTRIPLTIQSIVIAPNAVAGGDSAVGTVTLSAAASTGGATVSLTNDNNSVVTTPASFLIPEGATTGTFNITTVTSLTTTAVVFVTATVEGDSKSASISVSPWLTALTLSNDTVVGGNTVGGRVTLFRGAPTGGVNVNMASTVPAIASVPAIVQIPEGINTATFDVTTTGVANPQTVDITATYLGLTRTVTLTIVPARLFALSFVPTVVSGGTDISGKVQLDGAAPIGGVIVALSVSNPAVTVPATVSIPAQQSSVTFAAQTAFVAANTSVNVTATFGVDTRVAVIDVLRANLISLTLTPDVIQGGNTSIGTIGLDAPAATGGVTIPVTSSNPAVAQVPAAVVIPSGSTNTTFLVTTSVVGTQQLVTISATRGPATLNSILTVNPITFSIALNPTTVTGGQNSVGTLTLTEAAPAAGTTITLSSNNATVTVPSSVTIASGGTQATFNVSTTPISANALVTITATLAASNATANLNVLASGVNSLSITPSIVSGGASATGTLTMTGVAPVGGTIVTLSSDTVAATVPATVTVPQGGSSRTFTVNTTPVTSNVTATITATANSISASDTLDILAANLSSIQFNPSRVRGGQNTVMTVTLDAAAPPGGAIVTINSSNTSIANIPATVTVLGGQSSRSVVVTTRRVSRTLTSTVTATYGTTAAFTTLTVTR